MPIYGWQGIFIVGACSSFLGRKIKSHFKIIKNQKKRNQTYGYKIVKKIQIN